MRRSRGSRLLYGTTFTWILILSTSPAKSIPAFARKYGLRCTACHEAWPALNDFGRAFRDNGYQMLLGKDEPTTAPPGYWPISIRITPHYEFNSLNNQVTDQGKKELKTGGFADIGMDLLTGGTLGKNVSFLVVPTGFTQEEGVTLESAWIRLDNILDSSWLNLKVGKHELDLPRSAHRPWNLSDTGYLIYGFHAPGSASLFDMGENQRGVEYSGHDRGSLDRIAISLFNVEESPGSRNGFDTPGVYLHASHERQLDSSAVSSFRIGVFGSYTTWPTTFLTSGGVPISGSGGDLQAATKYGLEGHLWLGPAATPFHAILVFARGSDSRGLIPGAARDGTFEGGFLEFGYTPTLKSTYFGRWDLIKNLQQAVSGTAKDFNDENADTVGLRHTINFSSRAEYAIHAELSRMETIKGAQDGSDLRAERVFVGFDFAF